MRLKFTGELCVTAMKNGAKTEEELTCQFNIDLRNLTNFDPSIENLKIFHFNKVLLTKVNNVWNKKKYRGVIFDGTEYWCKIWRKNDLCFQKWHEVINTFLPEHVRKSKNWDFNGVLLSKVENVWPWNLQGSFASWQWRMMQNLKRNWLVSSKLTRGIWQILTRALENLKNFHFNRLHLTKVYKVWAKKSMEGLCLMALKIDAKFKFDGKLTFAF